MKCHFSRSQQLGATGKLLRYVNKVCKFLRKSAGSDIRKVDPTMRAEARGSTSLAEALAEALLFFGGITHKTRNPFRGSAAEAPWTATSAKEPAEALAGGPKAPDKLKSLHGGGKVLLQGAPYGAPGNKIPGIEVIRAQHHASNYACFCNAAAMLSSFFLTGCFWQCSPGPYDKYICGWGTGILLYGQNESMYIVYSLCWPLGICPSLTS